MPRYDILDYFQIPFVSPKIITALMIAAWETWWFGCLAGCNIFSEQNKNVVLTCSKENQSDKNILSKFRNFNHLLSMTIIYFWLKCVLCWSWIVIKFHMVKSNKQSYTYRPFIWSRHFLALSMMGVSRFYLNNDWGYVLLHEIDFLSKICWSIPCLQTPWRALTWNINRCKFESSQKDENRAQSTDSLKAYRKPNAFKCSG